MSVPPTIKKFFSAARAKRAMKFFFWSLSFISNPCNPCNPCPKTYFSFLLYVLTVTQLFTTFRYSSRYCAAIFSTENDLTTFSLAARATLCLICLFLYSKKHFNCFLNHEGITLHGQSLPGDPITKVSSGDRTRKPWKDGVGKICCINWQRYLPHIFIITIATFLAPLFP